MGIKLAQLQTLRQTPVVIAERDAEGKEDLLVLNIRHKRITPQVSNELLMITSRVSSEQEDFWEKVKKSDGELDIETMPRNWLVEQLAYLLDYTDVEIENGEILPPTSEQLERLPTNILTAMRREIDESSVPKKTLSSNSKNGMSEAAKSDLPRVG